MSRLLPLALGGLALTSLVACPTRAPVGPPPVHIPPGCERSQAGEYHHVGNPAFRYLARDDGRTLSLTLLHSRADGGVEGAPDAGAITITLDRTPKGFIGETHATGFSAGTRCPVKFPTEITACAPDSLTLRSVERTALDQACRPAPRGPAPTWTEQVLRRGPPPEPSPEMPDAGAGTPDAGPRAQDGGVSPPDAGTATPDAGPSDGGALKPPGGPAPRKP